MTDRYVELHAASAFSFLEGASQPEKLVERAVELEMPAMALLDRNGVYGSARFHTSATRNDIRAHVGAEISVSSLGPRLTPPAWLPHQHVAEPARLPLLCESREGYQNLCQLITRFKMREKSKGEGCSDWVDGIVSGVSDGGGPSGGGKDNQLGLVGGERTAFFPMPLNGSTAISLLERVARILTCSE